MKKMNKKGFTIVELVIVIAVIAILAAVLIPTFSGVVSKANQSAALQEATSTMKAALAMSNSATLSDKTLFVIGDKTNVNFAYWYKNNKIEDALAAGDDKLFIKDGQFVTAENGSTQKFPVAYNTTDSTKAKYNAIIVSDEFKPNGGDAGSTYSNVFKNILAKTIENVDVTSIADADGAKAYNAIVLSFTKCASDATASAAAEAANSKYYKLENGSYTKVAVAANENVANYYTANEWHIYTSTDFAKDIVVFTYSN